MPRLVDELTPLQSMWLYENQSLTRVSDDEPIDLWTAMNRTSSEVFRERERERERAAFSVEPVPLEENRKRKRDFNDDSSSQQWDFPFHRCRPVDSSDGDSISRWPQRPSNEWGRRPEFPHFGDKLTWEQSYDNLVAYKEVFGDCNVPQKYKENRKLGGWVNKQRKKKKNPEKYGRLSNDQVERLTELGFKWQ